jgi:hypothetical protein
MKYIIALIALLLIGGGGYYFFGPHQPAEEDTREFSELVEQLDLEYSGIELNQVAKLGDRTVYWASSPEVSIKIVVEPGRFNDNVAAMMEGYNEPAHYYYGGKWKNKAPWIRNVRGVATGEDSLLHFTAYPTDTQFASGYVRQLQPPQQQSQQ